MKPIYRGALATGGIITGFLTLVFLFQTVRYLNLALLGDLVSLGMFGIYVLLTSASATATAIAFIPRYTTAKYVSGAGIGVGSLLFLTAVYLFTTDIASGMMMLLFAVMQLGVAGGVYAVAHSMDSTNDEDDQPAAREVGHGAESAEDSVRSEAATGGKSSSAVMREEPDHDDESEVSESAGGESDSGEAMDDKSERPFETPMSSSDGVDRGRVWRAVQVFTGLVVFIVGLPLTIQSPVGVPVLVLGLAIIPAVRKLGMEKLGR